jgi:hypothetical protein
MPGNTGVAAGVKPSSSTEANKRGLQERQKGTTKRWQEPFSEKTTKFLFSSI